MRVAARGNTTNICKNKRLCSQTAKGFQSRVCHDFIGDVQTGFNGHECWISTSCESSKLEVVFGAPDASLCTIGSLVDHCEDVLGERGDEARLGRRTRNFDRTQPKSIQATSVRKARNIPSHQYLNILSCNFAKLWLPMGAILVWVSDSIHDHLGIKACAITVDFIGELIVYEKENHEIASYSNAV
jgi:hypothetical protein